MKRRITCRMPLDRLERLGNLDLGVLVGRIFQIARGAKRCARFESIKILWVMNPSCVCFANRMCLTADPSLRPGASLRACGGALHKQRFAMRSLYGGNDNVRFGRIPSVPVLRQGKHWLSNVPARERITRRMAVRRIYTYH